MIPFWHIYSFSPTKKQKPFNFIVAVLLLFDSWRYKRRFGLVTNHTQFILITHTIFLLGFCVFVAWLSFLLPISLLSLSSLPEWKKVPSSLFLYCRYFLFYDRSSCWEYRIVRFGIKYTFVGILYSMPGHIYITFHILCGGRVR